MKTTSKRICSIGLLLLLIGLIGAKAQTVHTALLRIGVVDTAYNQNEWAVYVYVDLFDQNNNLMSPLSDDKYTWWIDICDGNELHQTYGAGYVQKWDGMKHQKHSYCDPNTFYDTYQIAAKVTLPSGGTIMTPLLQLPDEGVPVQNLAQLLNRNVTIDQKLSDGTTSVDWIGLWRNDAETPLFVKYPAPFTMAFRPGFTKTLKGGQSLYPGSPLQKYNQWNSVADVSMIRTFTIQSSTIRIQANFKPTYNATLQLKMDGTVISDANTLDFRDPWLVDYADPSYGGELRNRGMTNAINKPVGLSTNNIGTGTSYKGVFLNQAIGSGNTYYSTRASLVKKINGMAAFFSSWSASGVNIQDNGVVGTDDCADVMFTASDAAVIANYTGYTVAKNATLGAGTWTMAGTLTVNSGATLTIASGATLVFPPNTGLVINGALSANGATFTSSSGNWSGITINSTSGCSLQNCTISYANNPVTLNSTGTSVTMQSCTINNSNFGGDAAIRVNNSSPSMRLIQIYGQSGSANGVRFASGSGGILQESSIQNLGNGNGIVVQGNSSPTIEQNTIAYNRLTGIIMYSNGTGNPTIRNNTLNMNGVVNGTRTYTGLSFYQSGGLAQGNNVQNSNYGICCDTYSSPTSGTTGQVGGNIVTNNNHGLVATGYSNPAFGGCNIPRSLYWGVCNKVYSNAGYDAFATNHSTLTARVNWWGQYPLNPAKFTADGTSYVDNAYPETSVNGCPLGGGGGAKISDAETGSTAGVNSDFASTLKIAAAAKCDGDIQASLASYKTVLAEKAASSFHQEALAGIYGALQASGDAGVVAILEHYESSDNNLKLMASELLASAYAATGRIADAEALFQKLRAENTGTDIEKRALIFLASLGGFDRKYSEQSAAALAVLTEKYGSSVSADLLRALNTSSGTNSQEATHSSALADQEVQTKDVNLTIYPNPFNPTTTLSYQLLVASRVSLRIYDLLGREVSVLVDGFEEAGYHSTEFDGSKLSSGVYLGRFVVQPQQGKPIVQVRKILLTK